MEERFFKIISATYKLLDFFPEGDPLKHKAKERVLLIAEKLTFNNSGADLADDIAVLESYLEIAKGQGWFSGMNFSIIAKEWEVLRSQVVVSKRVVEKVKPAKPAISANRLRHREIEPIEPAEYSPRQRKILVLLGKKERAQVQDIVKEMPDVTKRTIRRDLDDLLKRGEITRVGEFNQVFYQKSDRTHFLA